MTETATPNMDLYWNEALAEELFRFLTGRIKCPETAADLTHETFLRFHQFIQTTPPNNARALVFSIAVNLATDYQRKMKVRQKVMVDEDHELNRLNYAQNVADTGSERIVMARQQLELACAALDELPTDCRTAFMMHSIDGLTQVEIANRLGVSQAKVYRLITKAMSHCQKRLNTQNEPKK